MVTLATALALLGEGGTGVMMVAMFLVYWGSPIAFEVLRDGQTVGKRVMGLRVVNANGTPVTNGQGGLASITIGAGDQFSSWIYLDELNPPRALWAGLMLLDLRSDMKVLDVDSSTAVATVPKAPPGSRTVCGGAPTSSRSASR